MSDIVIIDTETTGFDPKVNEVIDIFVIRIDGLTGEIISFGGDLIIPYRLQYADSKAMAMNYFDAKRWAKEAVTWPEAYENIKQLVKDAIVCGHAVDFDIRMIRAMNERFQLPEFPWVQGKKFDTCKLAESLKKNNLIPDRKLGTVAKYLGIEIENQHSARGDAIATFNVFKQITDWWPEQKGEQ